MTTPALFLSLAIIDDHLEGILFVVCGQRGRLGGDFGGIEAECGE
jgi:hypothetical protein